MGAIELAQQAWMDREPPERADVARGGAACTAAAGDVLVAGRCDAVARGIDVVARHADAGGNAGDCRVGIAGLHVGAGASPSRHVPAWRAPAQLAQNS
jgi:hypothetical protein